ncbi:conserved hypothetical protein [Ricinus communis]|uniref:Uncharacterized protein n=1 Tax=Ricinus communis TaxID=3988 RepID=B9TIF1_RICCO|nr:conserved hypothetical protein [Ricinus communis]
MPYEMSPNRPKWRRNGVDASPAMMTRNGSSSHMAAMLCPNADADIAAIARLLPLPVCAASNNPDGVEGRRRRKKEPNSRIQLCTGLNPVREPQN